MCIDVYCLPRLALAPKLNVWLKLWRKTAHYPIPRRISHCLAAMDATRTTSRGTITVIFASKASMLDLNPISLSAKSKIRLEYRRMVECLFFFRMKLCTLCIRLTLSTFSTDSCATRMRSRSTGLGNLRRLGVWIIRLDKPFWNHHVAVYHFACTVMMLCVAKRVRSS